MTNPLISVIVPIYKVESYLDRCVASLVEQTYNELEIILVDDGSPDKCPDMCDEWAKKDSRIKVIHKANGGLSDARNAGMAIASGEYIGFVDSDDWLETDFCEKLLQALIDNSCDIAACNYRRVSGEENIESDKGSGAIICYDKNQAMSELIDNTIQQVVWNKLYKSTVVEGILFEKGKYHEDEFWSYQVFGRCEKIVTVEYIGYNYLQREASIMGERYSLKRLDAVEAKVRRCSYLKEKFPKLYNKGCINLVFTCMYHGQLALQQLNSEEKKVALSVLKETVRNCNIKSEDIKELSAMHKLWVHLSRCAFRLTCVVRNVLKIGF